MSDNTTTFIALIAPIITYLDLVIIAGNTVPTQPKLKIVKPINISNSLQCQVKIPRSEAIVEAVKQNEHNKVVNKIIPNPKTNSIEYLEYNFIPSEISHVIHILMGRV